MSTSRTLDDLRRSMASFSPRVAGPDGKREAAVAAILTQRDGRLQLLFIERTEKEGDPWSGHVAFPGGMVEAVDAHPRSAAERETLEEIGLDLAEAEHLGRLSDIESTVFPLVISAFVYAVSSPVDLVVNYEVREAFWVPIEDLVSPERHTEIEFYEREPSGIHPAIDLLGPDRPLLWGITLGFVMELVRVIHH